MARIRTIKPEFFTSEDIVALTPLARLFYVSLWCESDREGRLKWAPKTLKMRYFPADECDIQALAGEVLGAGLVHTYIVDGVEYAYIPSFPLHQSINNKEKDSVLPEPPFSSAATKAKSARHTKHNAGNGAEHVQLIAGVDASKTCESGDLDATEGKGKEGKGKERNNTPLIPQMGEAEIFVWLTCSDVPYGVTVGKLAEYRASFPSVDVEAEARSAAQWAADNPKKAPTYQGATRFIGNWFRKASKDTTPAANRYGRQPDDGGLARDERRADVMRRWNVLRSSPDTTTQELIDHSKLVIEVNPGMALQVEMYLAKRGAEVARA